MGKCVRHSTQVQLIRIFWGRPLRMPQWYIVAGVRRIVRWKYDIKRLQYTSHLMLAKIKILFKQPLICVLFISTFYNLLIF